MTEKAGKVDKRLGKFRDNDFFFSDKMKYHDLGDELNITTWKGDLLFKYVKDTKKILFPGEFEDNGF